MCSNSLIKWSGSLLWTHSTLKDVKVKGYLPQLLTQKCSPCCDLGTQQPVDAKTFVYWLRGWARDRASPILQESHVLLALLAVVIPWVEALSAVCLVIIHIQYVCPCWTRAARKRASLGMPVWPFHCLWQYLSWFFPPSRIQASNNSDIDCSEFQRGNTVCPASYDPLCGSDGKTYGNRCQFCSAYT